MGKLRTFWTPTAFYRKKCTKASFPPLQKMTWDPRKQHMPPPHRSVRGRNGRVAFPPLSEVSPWAWATWWAFGWSIALTFVLSSVHQSKLTRSFTTSTRVYINEFYLFFPSFNLWHRCYREFVRNHPYGETGLTTHKNSKFSYWHRRVSQALESKRKAAQKCRVNWELSWRMQKQPMRKYLVGRITHFKFNIVDNSLRLWENEWVILGPYS